MKINSKKIAGKAGGRRWAWLLGGFAVVASSLANAAFTEEKLNDIAEKDDNGAIIVYHAGTGGKPANAFDGNTETYYENDNPRTTIGWVGLGISSPRNLSKVRYMPRKDQARRMRDCLIQGANNSDFSDAVTLHVIKSENLDIAQYQWVEEKVTTEAGLCHTYRYFRLYAPNVFSDPWSTNTGSCGGNVVELEFYGGELPTDESAPTKPDVTFAGVINGIANFRLASRTEDAYGYELQRQYAGETGWTSLVSIPGKTASSKSTWLRIASSTAVAAVYRVYAVSPAGASYDEFKAPAAYRLTGKVLGNGDQYQKVYDGKPETFNDHSEPSTGWAGQDFGAERVITGVRYVKREGGDGPRIRGAMFQIATTADFSDAVTVYVAPTDHVPEFEVVTATFDKPVKARYARFYSSENGYGNIAECEWTTLPTPEETPSAPTVVRDSLRDQYALLTWQTPAMPFMYSSVGILRKIGDDGEFELLEKVSPASSDYVDQKLEYGIKVSYALSYIRTVESVDYFGEASTPSEEYTRAMRLERDWDDLSKVKAGVSVICNKPNSISGNAEKVFDGNNNTFADIYVDGKDTGYLVGVDLGTGYKLAFSRVLPRQNPDGNTRAPGSVLYGANSTEGWDGTEVSKTMSFPPADSFLGWGEFESKDKINAYRYFWIKRPDGGGYCNYAEVELYGYPVEVLTAPGNFTCVNKNATLLTWTEATLATSYVVQRKTPDQFVWEDLAEVGNDVFSYRDSNLPSRNKEYSYRVVSVGTFGMRIPSEAKTIFAAKPGFNISVR